MIKFFSTIRRGLLSQGRFGKYVTYALGEILLVVVGILIALQINNWNEFQKDRKQEQELLSQLHSEFQSNLVQLDQKMAQRNDMIRASLELLDYIDHPETRNRDSIVKYLALTMMAPTFDPIVNDLVSSGRVQLLQNADLKKRLSLWTSEIIQVTEEEDAWQNYRSITYTPFLIENIPQRILLNQFWKSNTLKSFHLDQDFKSNLDLGASNHEWRISSLLDDPKMESHVSRCASLSEIANSQSYSLRKRIAGILEIINQELQ